MRAMSDVLAKCHVSFHLLDNQGCLDRGCRVTVRFKLIALIYGSIISSLSKSGIDAASLRAPRPAERWLSFLGWSPFFI